MSRSEEISDRVLVFVAQLQRLSKAPVDQDLVDNLIGELLYLADPENREDVPDDELVADVFAAARQCFELVGYANEDKVLDLLPEGLRTAHLIFVTCGGVFNGGIEAFIWQNSDSFQNAAIATFRRLGEQKLSEILQEVVSINRQCEIQADDPVLGRLSNTFWEVHETSNIGECLLRYLRDQECEVVPQIKAD